MCPSLSFFFPPVIHMSVIFSRFSSLPLSYLLLCIRIFYVFDTRMTGTGETSYFTVIVVGYFATCLRSALCY
ncbi:hypothetical protein BKA83DRAFT_4363739 [Pisolithus microcarpus]|nr:hypothetical protein BKA83DRAFT_4363739 [Pisolithus microcarpus]